MNEFVLSRAEHSDLLLVLQPFARCTTRAAATFEDLTLLPLTLRWVKAVHSAAGRVLAVTPSTDVQVRYAVRPHPLQPGHLDLINLDQFRAPDSPKELFD